MTTHPLFRLGDSWGCVERRSGYAPDRPDNATFAVRNVKPGRLRTRMPVLSAAQAAREHCDVGTAGGLHVLIAAAGLNGGPPMNRIVGFDAGEYPINHEATAH